MDSDLQELAALASQVRKSLHWAVFLVLAMALILVIDLQLKKSIGEMAVEVARGRGQAPSTASDPAPASDRDHGVERTPGVAKGSIQSDGPGEDAKSPSVDGAAKRPRGNGRRTGGPQ